mmetsp:Transcript_124739/g.312006  ORF Transcript_124739/g.312006 Transcript_124739/m.312006 type:complete len:252 (+) Transcript_124739:343-1098(+)
MARLVVWLLLLSTGHLILPRDEVAPRLVTPLGPRWSSQARVGGPDDAGKASLALVELAFQRCNFVAGHVQITELLFRFFHLLSKALSPLSHHAELLVANDLLGLRALLLPLDLAPLPRDVVLELRHGRVSLLQLLPQLLQLPCSSGRIGVRTGFVGGRIPLVCTVLAMEVLLLLLEALQLLAQPPYGRCFGVDRNSIFLRWGCVLQGRTGKRSWWWLRGNRRACGIGRMLGASLQSPDFGLGLQAADTPTL